MEKRPFVIIITGDQVGPVLDPKKGVCADPVDRAAILEKRGPDPHSRDRERQLTPDKGSGKT